MYRIMEKHNYDDPEQAVAAVKNGLVWSGHNMSVGGTVLDPTARPNCLTFFTSALELSKLLSGIRHGSSMKRPKIKSAP